MDTNLIYARLRETYEIAVRNAAHEADAVLLAVAQTMAELMKPPVATLGGGDVTPEQIKEFAESTQVIHSDTERLDWWQVHPRRVQRENGLWRCFDRQMVAVGYRDDIREAIDYARSFK